MQNLLMGLIIQHAEEHNLSANGVVNESETATRMGLKESLAMPNL